MPRSRFQISTGLPGLDRVFRGLMPGDNIVWQIESIEDYQPFVVPYVEHAVRHRLKLIYFRFADHEPLLQPDVGVEIVELHPDAGFEPFISAIHGVISARERGCFYLFDCLSKLAPDWNSDRMLGNFFMLTCPYLYDRAAIAYFSVLRNYHSFHAMSPISGTTQILVDSYRRNGKLYIQPRKVQHRHSVTMYMLHVLKDNGEFEPVTQSALITETLSGSPWSSSDISTLRQGCWSRTFAEAETLQRDIDRGHAPPEQAEQYRGRLLRMLIARDGPILTLAEKYFSLRDILAIRRRMIGTGLIGGKAVGMLLARAILEKNRPPWPGALEPHDSFYVGADVFYTYLVQNGCWWMMQKHKQDFAADETETTRRRILAGDFPEYILKQFDDMLDYFAQSPIIVRSSSILEDSFGNAFAGKYESVFCANQGGPHKRLEDFLCAVRAVYASTMSETALAYRSARGLLDRDEQMALLIQRVSGDSYENLFFPHAAGVAFSFNPYVWHNDIDPRAGMVRLVFGIGTRAVDRYDDDYTRIVALNEPMRRPEADFEQVKQYAQRRVDVLDMEANQLASVDFSEIVKRNFRVPLDFFAARDTSSERSGTGRGGDNSAWVLTFDRLLKATSFVSNMRGMLQILSEAYKHPVDVEFTLNFFDETRFCLNVVQCRPLQIMDTGSVAPAPDLANEERAVFASRGPVIGKSLDVSIDWILYVPPSAYSELPMQERYELARTIGEVTHHPRLAGTRIMLMGPGRWATTSPELGVPVVFADIEKVSIVCEIVAMRENLAPDVSLGTHFFNELVENNMLYAALFPNREGYRMDAEWLERKAPNMVGDLVKERNPAVDAIRLINASAKNGPCLRFYANVMEQRAICAFA